jgi:hypothetical protein
MVVKINEVVENRSRSGECPMPMRWLQSQGKNLETGLEIGMEIGSSHWRR